MKIFEDVAMERFEDEMVVHSHDFTPTLCEVLGEQQVRVAVRRAIAHATTYGFTLRGPIRLYIELMFLFGSAFDSDPLCKHEGEILRERGDQMERAQRLHEGTLKYVAEVAGPKGANVNRALRELAVFANRPFTVTSDRFVETMLGEMHRMFPERATYVGDRALTALLEEALAEAQKHRFDTPRGQALLLSLMFAFGHRCIDDPLYPWISRTLEDDRILDPASRAVRLERKALTWLEHVLGRPEQGAAI